MTTSRVARPQIITHKTKTSFYSDCYVVLMAAALRRAKMIVAAVSNSSVITIMPHWETVGIGGVKEVMANDRLMLCPA